MFFLVFFCSPVAPMIKSRASSMNGMLRNCLRQSDYNRYTFFFSYYHLFGSFSFIAYTHTHCLLRFFTATFSGECLVKNFPTLSYDLCRVRVTGRTKKNMNSPEKNNFGFSPCWSVRIASFLFVLARGRLFYFTHFLPFSLSLPS